MEQYLNKLREILISPENEVQINRTGVPSITILGGELEFNVSERLPATTTKPTPIKWCVKEMLWFLSGDTNVRSLALEKVPFWDMNGFDFYLKNQGMREAFPTYSREWWNGLKDFLGRIKSDEEFAKVHGDLGPVYGAQFRRAGTVRGKVDQVTELVDNLMKEPYSRRHIINLWNVGEIPKMALPPCLYSFQLAVRKDFVDAKITQRSSDFFLAGSSNQTQYALLLAGLAQMIGRKPRRLQHDLGDAHIYCGKGERAKFYQENLPELRERIKRVSESYDVEEILSVNDWILKNAPTEREGEEGLDHVTGAIEQLARLPNTLPPKYSVANKHVLDLTIDDLKVEDYHPQASIKRTMAV